ncbi:MAG: xanthine dehydrogenase family protein subunit M [Tissierellia bacterium]|nr:xanthine dehydrogenase family protein subunit M [Tissierellia bacterium]
MDIKKVYNSKSVEEVIDILGEYGEKAKVIAGGTDIVIALNNNAIEPELLIDISKLEELKGIKVDKEFITIGSATTFTEIVESEIIDNNLYGLHKACKMVGSPQIRNKGTIGGNIANGSPAADSVPPLIALGGIVTLKSIEGTREVLLEDYYYNPIKEKELLLNIKFERPKDNQILTFAKLGLRKALAISRLTLSSFIEFDDNNTISFIRVASGALAKFPMREKELEDYLLGKILEKEIIEGAIEALRNSMDERLKGRSTLPYKRIAISTILREILEEALAFEEGVKAW